MKFSRILSIAYLSAIALGIIAALVYDFFHNDNIASPLLIVAGLMLFVSITAKSIMIAFKIES